MTQWQLVKKKKTVGGADVPIDCSYFSSVRIQMNSKKKKKDCTSKIIEHSSYSKIA